MSLFYIKLVSIPVFFLVGYFMGLFPLKMKTDARGQRRFAQGNAFALGIFLGAGLLHLLPDSQHHWILWQGPYDFPWSLTIAGLGILFVLLMEEGVLGGSEDLGTITSEQKSFYPYLLCVILSIHSMIAGVSLGLETAFLSVVVLLIALMAHKGSAAFALGVSLRQGEFSKKSHRQLIALFSTMVPIGVLLGMWFSFFFTGKTDSAFEAIFDGLAAGTFLYIALIDMLPEIFEKKSDQGIKLLLIMTGFAVMTAIAIIA